MALKRKVQPYGTVVSEREFEALLRRTSEYFKMPGPRLVKKPQSAPKTTSAA